MCMFDATRDEVQALPYPLTPTVSSALAHATPKQGHQMKITPLVLAHHRTMETTNGYGQPVCAGARAQEM